MVIFDFLRRVVGEKTLDDVLERRKSRYGDVEVWAPRLEFYKPKHEAFMPVEFSVAAYRFGHSMIRNTYKLNTTVPPEGVRLLIFSFGAPTTGFPRLTHLGGFRQLPPQWPVEWRFFFDDLGDAVEPPPFVQSSRKIDTRLAEELSRLPDNVATGIKALAARNLMRGSTMGLPSGQDVAAAMGFRPLSGKQVGLGGRPAPLWYYILKEAEVGGGETLGPVGGHIVAEVFVGLLAKDASSWLKRRPGWKPFLGREEGKFTMSDLIRFSGYGLKVI
jgi:hypothetical protein